MNYKHIIASLFSFVLTFNSYAQTLDPVIENPQVVEINKLSARATFFAFESKGLAEANKVEDTKN